MIRETPPNWGKDSISEFISHAVNNIFATFVHKEKEFSFLVNIDSILQKLTNLTIPDPEENEKYALIMINRTHSSFLSAVRFSCSGQIPETFCMLRNCLENALYGYYFLKVDGSCEIWNNRNRNEKDRKEVKKIFKIVNLKNELEKESSELTSEFSNLYDSSIDYGAHPNEATVNITLQAIQNDNNTYTIRSSYLNNDSELIKLSLIAVSRTGLWCLKIFKLMFSKRFDLLSQTKNSIGYQGISTMYLNKINCLPFYTKTEEIGIKPTMLFCQRKSLIYSPLLPIRYPAQINHQPNCS